MSTHLTTRVVVAHVQYRIRVQLLSLQHIPATSSAFASPPPPSDAPGRPLRIDHGDAHDGADASPADLDKPAVMDMWNLIRPQVRS